MARGHKTWGQSSPDALALGIGDFSVDKVCASAVSLIQKVASKARNNGARATLRSCRDGLGESGDAHGWSEAELTMFTWIFLDTSSATSHEACIPH